ncbi:flagellar biosynthesis anti-sigma factor FlgM [Teredinibacter haidensis]|uniref:flagellar biosynthesis anti-sigma factor FlgM n=1 Tax=Teredinibacter haidensis TaxID=2731755 RepID=UPI000948E094|nr:flagellar biosynthesis anti-sigma factor FlgM [Teredinibacter haidensis]
MVIEPGNGFNTNNLSSVGTGKARQGGAVAPASNKPEATNTGAHSTSDSVSLSTAGQALAKLEAQAANIPEVDSAKVAEIRTALQNGSYNIDPDAIASKMIEQDNLL